MLPLNLLTLWQADAKAQPGRLKAVTAQNSLVEEFCGNTTDIQDDSSPSATPTSLPASQSEKRVSNGAIGGIVVGAVSGVALLGGVCFVLLRKNGSEGSKLRWSRRNCRRRHIIVDRTY
ncbi:hypothetical protein K469DRAFT_690016 [Zopfia rhizophila CBS 207.26]|uniref:Mid2 domain-containing protein n=1 Tax=Zopfia rhizophila CBS 207.26 TaxID=1314779 RepID=A0A6A6E039_9PEZI|nr:hypothetical protein K469DRAFT_690016 [Zopfia rhizophila CBS 207.26]